MAEINIPNQDFLRNKNWTGPIRNVPINRSEFSGQSKAFATNAYTPWRLTANIRPIVQESVRGPWRAFYSLASDKTNFFRVRKACNQYRGAGSPSLIAVQGSGQVSNGILLKNCPPSQFIARAGQYLTIPISANRVILACAAIDGGANGTGDAFITLTAPLVLPALDSGLVEVNNPYLLMRLTNPESGFSESGGLFNMSLECEEYV